MSEPQPLPLREEVERRLRAALDPSALRIDDESHLHRGHAGAKGGGAHLRVAITSRTFSGKPLLAQHRLVQDAVRDLIASGRIHALALQTRAEG